MTTARLTTILNFLPFLTLSAWAQDMVTVNHYQVQSRYEFGLNLLDLALSKSATDYEIISPYKDKTTEINEARGEVEVISGILDIEFLSTTKQRESSMIPIRIPIYQGILGLRLLLVKPSMNRDLSRVNNLQSLRSFTAGHGVHWGDLPVYGANNLPVVTSNQYESLFKMLIGGRFDYFARGVNEIWAELDRYSKDLVVADKVMLFYPHPVYFFISKHRPELALLVGQGLEIAIEDGSYRQLFLDNFAESINNARLEERNLIILRNPVIPQDTPAIDATWWMPAKFNMNE